MIDSLLLQQAGTCTRKLCTRSKGPERQGVASHSTMWYHTQSGHLFLVPHFSTVISYRSVKNNKQTKNSKDMGHYCSYQLCWFPLPPPSPHPPNFIFFFLKKLEATFCSNFFCKGKSNLFGAFFFLTLTYYIVYFTDQCTLNESYLRRKEMLKSDRIWKQIVHLNLYLWTP